MSRSLWTIKVETWIGIMVIIAVSTFFGVTVFSKIINLNSYVDSLSDEYAQEGLLMISSREIKRVEAWLAVNDLNKYGDSEGTFYIGGTPLFNEATGERIGRFDYILQNNPGRPWR